MQAVVVSIDAEGGRFHISTKVLEPTPGDMLRDPQVVFDNAERMAEEFRSPPPSPTSSISIIGQSDMSLSCLITPVNSTSYLHPCLQHPCSMPAIFH
jgi:hypothetical protein